MFFLLLYLMLVTLAMAFFPAWSTAASLLGPLAVVALARLVLALTAKKQKTPGDVSTTGGQD
jgi:hypothetical protein